jgi:pyrimidine-nucleoside phosphorylase
MAMRAVDVIRAVRDKQSLEDADLTHFIEEVTAGKIPDYQTSAFLMAVYHQGLSDAQTVALTLAMRDSGQVITHKGVDAPKVDKHSTGGVGDKISIPLAPWVAACGVPVPMISGRGLGHTGGTLDKLESIPGFRVNLGIERFQEMVRDIGVSLVGQTENLAPADRKIYSLRDVTATVESVPLITASILSKKLAEGIDALVLDVKVGRGAFMKDEASARILAESLVRVGRGAGLNMRAVLTRMDDPLGRFIGNALETQEAINILKGEGPQDTTELTRVLAREMLHLGKVVQSDEQANKLLDKTCASGKALEKFGEIIEAQGGDRGVLDDPTRLPQAPNQHVVTSDTNGYVAGVDAYALAMFAMRLGAGRATADATIDPSVGLEILKKRGQSVELNEPILRIFHRGPLHINPNDLQQAFDINSEKQPTPALIIDKI